MSNVVIVIPCFNEEKRFDPRSLEELLTDAEVSVLLVNDGSRDGTLEVLREAAASHPARVSVLDLERNGGKGEAVRQGLLRALGAGAPIVAYLDADFATPASEMLRLLDHARRSTATMVLASRVRLLGRHVERDPIRHGLGRVFATAGSLVLDLPIYDTQCGAKVLRDCPALRQALSVRFRSRWAFDVELIKRLLVAPRRPLTGADFLEVPVREWRDKAGSKLTAGAMAKAAFDLARIRFFAERWVRDLPPHDPG